MFLAKIVKVFYLTFIFVLLATYSFAQCAMCKATVENNVSNGEIGIAGNLNAGILYLFVMPYLAIGLIGYFWYKSSKSNAKKKSIRSHRSF